MRLDQVERRLDGRIDQLGNGLGGRIDRLDAKVDAGFDALAGTLHDVRDMLRSTQSRRSS